MDSGKILTFLKKLPIEIPKERLSPLSRIFIDKIIHQIHLGENAWKTNTSYREHVLGSDEFPKGADFHHIVDEIRKEIETFRKIGKKYSFVIGGRTFTIYAIVPYKSRVVAKRVYAYLDECVKKMFIWLHVATHFAPGECSRELAVYWYLTGHQKRLPDFKGEPVDQEHANTAFTMACPIGVANSIYIFRKEEWFKVFIHETFHSLGLDFARMPEDVANRALFSIFPVRCDYRFYEAYTETWATILHSLFLSMESRGSIYPKLEAYLEKERMFSLFQKGKLLNHHQFKYKHLCSSGTAGRYRENTQAFSYFVLKSILLFHYNGFIEWCAHKNKGAIAFKRLPPNVLSLVDFVRTNHKGIEYTKALESTENWVSSTRYKGPEMTTMRMTALA
jgi:hypothetical protein